ncbi:activator of HSP90 ATPase [Rudanella paleaurantiibacter]|uniref:Activator of HSP90 ATPase n=1 Tax=Rudanella paleaurantiibacter TaxID=2614655 RepID=A0A7J5U0Z8_9BACT|nr:SRPBCC family protein [Rudanella paleaurantiibacter]KAB7731221.1 activator of HSP90 ATPase [Rudanella paleaurantiibacter]
MEPTKITIQASVAAPASKVWAYWTEPAHITRWNFATDDWQCPHAENDLRPGGKYVARMEAKDGSFGFDFEAIYDRVADGQELAYTMPDGRQVTTRFDAQDNTTLITTTFDAESQNPVEMQLAGWQAILNNFKTYTETN